MSEPGLVWQADQYVSSVLDKPAFSLRLPKKLDEAVLSELKAWLMSGEPEFVSLKTPSADVAAADFLREAGFLVMDELVTLEKLWPADEAEPTVTGYTLRWAEDSDEEAVVALAGRAFSCSRWHVDPLIPKEQADAMKATWAANYWRGLRGDAMAIVASEGKAVGFLQVIVKDGVLVLDLIAVDEGHRGKGLGSALVQWVPAAWKTLPHFAKASRGRPTTIRVGTQGNNVASLALYTKVGFVEVSREKVWHWHKPA